MCHDRLNSSRTVGTNGISQIQQQSRNVRTIGIFPYGNETLLFGQNQHVCIVVVVAVATTRIGDHGTTNGRGIFRHSLFDKSQWQCRRGRMIMVTSNEENCEEDDPLQKPQCGPPQSSHVVVGSDGW